MRRVMAHPDAAENAKCQSFQKLVKWNDSLLTVHYLSLLSVCLCVSGVLSSTTRVANSSLGPTDRQTLIGNRTVESVVEARACAIF